MLKNIFNAVFGTRHTREVKRVQPLVEEVLGLRAALGLATGSQHD